ncbi:hypothetical protein RYH73_08375 [Olivibacter sp. CPCC 100613]|uniref:hypothetical protein n=1 Tax=Olivibacter sp. CPCC 100613 TaxID=3079931 RepID=UPI002FFB431C
MLLTIITFDHAKTIIAIILSLSITHLIKGMVNFIEHPKSLRAYWVHLLWCGYLLLLIIHFWWWEAALKDVSHWNFAKYFFLFLYINTYYVLCVLLMPSNLGEHKSYVDYFYSRKKWFFGTLGFCFLLDFIDTFIKGSDYFFIHYGWEYPIRNVCHIVLCIAAIYSSNRKFHAVLILLFLLYELSYIYRLF